MRAASGIPAQQGQSQGQVVEVEGIFEVSIEDSASGETIRYAITDGNTRWDVRIPPGQLKNLTTGSRVHARGRRAGQNTLDLSSNDSSMTTMALAAPNTFGAQRTIVILVNFTDNQTTTQTTADAAAVTFGSTNDFYVENSYGQTSLYGDVYGWYTIAMSSSVCDTNQLASLADQQASAHGVNLSLYTRKVYSFPKNACTWWGLGTVGGQPSQAWVNGPYTLKVVAHELGHNFGDYHSKSMPCDVSAGCSTVEYGDDRDVMGQCCTGHLNAFQKERLGWLNYGSSPAINTVTGPGTYWIDSLQTAGGTKALKILQSSASGNNYYYVEARTQTGFDGGYSPGVILHTGNDSNGDTSIQVDLDPQTTAFDSVLDPGQSFVDSAINLTITTSSLEAGGAWITVQMPQGPPCSYSISPTSSASLAYAGASSSFSMTAGAGCAWSASSPQSWIHTTSSGTGNGTISYSIDANAGGLRSGTISVGGRTYTVNQAAAPCSYALSPTSSGTLSGSGASGSTQMTAGSGCAWSASASKTWIHTSSSGAGNGTIIYTIDANTGQARTGTITAGGKTYTINQAVQVVGCSYSLSPTSSGTLASGGASGSFSITTTSGCAWTAATSDAWIHTSSTGTGSGSVAFTVDANSGPARSGSITAGGQTYSVSQAAAVCSYSISPASSGTLPAAAGGGSFAVTAGSWCGWSATTGDAWVHTSSSGTGNGSVTYTVDANPGAARSGSISVGGQVFAISQAAADCTYSINPGSSGTLASSGASGSFSVASSAWCAWSSSTTSPWIHTASSGNGSGTVTFTVDANPGAARSGSISVGGQTFSISQSAADCSYSISPASSGMLAASAASGSFSVASSAWCSWSSSTTFPWIHTSSAGNGAGTVAFTVDANSGAARNGSILVGGQMFSIYQMAADCSYALSPGSSGTLSVSGAAGSFSVISSSWCSWSAAANDPWVHTSSSGSGNGTVAFTVDANAGAVRSGSIVVGGQAFAISQAAADCSYALSPGSSGTLAASAASGSFSVASSAWCGWSSSTAFPWIHTSSSGSGNGTVTFTVDANSGAARNGSIVVGGQTFTISQAAADCAYSINPGSSGTLAASGVSGSFSVASSSWCAWSSSTTSPWIHPSGSGSGNGTVTFTVDSNSGAARSGSISVGGQTFAVSQAAAACSYSINPGSSGTLTAAAGGGSFAMTAGAWCSWTATTGDAWVQTSSSSNGNGTVTFTVDANSGAARNGSISVGGQTFAVSQAAAACSYSISPASSGTLAASGASSSFSVTSSSWCSWTATTGNSWVHTSSTGSGNGTVAYAVDANTGAARNGSISVGGQAFAVSQAAAPCSYSLNPTSSPLLASTAGSGSFAITAVAGCSWTATTAAGWIHTTSTGNGSGTVIYTVDSNNGAARTGTISVGGQTFTVSQAAGNCKTAPLTQSTSQLPASGGNGTVSAQAAQGPCKKTLALNASWITASLIDPDSETSTVTYTVEPNTDAPRVGTFTVDDQTFTIYQDGPGNSNAGGKKNGHDDDFTAVVDPATGLPTQWIATATSSRRFVESLGSFDLTGAPSSFYVESRLVAALSSARIEISTDETKWTTLANVPASIGWIGLDIDLTAYVGQTVYIRVVFDAVAPAAGTAPDTWALRKPAIIRH